MNTQTNVQTLSEFELEQASGGLVPLAIAFAVYSYAVPLFAAGVAVGIGEAMENRQ